MTNYPLTFAKFKTAIEAIIAHKAEIDAFTDAIRVAFDGCFAFCSLGNKSTGALVKLLDELTNDGDWVSWYIYECSGGKNPMSAFLADKTEIKVDSIEKLWEVIHA